MWRLFFLPLLLLITAAGGCAEVPATIASPQHRIAIAKVRLDADAATKMVNSYRAEKGLRPLTLDSRLTKAAHDHSADLAARDKITHKGSNGSDPWVRVEKAGYRPKLAAENVGAGQRSLEEVFRGWQMSPGHNKNLLLPDATQMGIALVTDTNSRYGTFWTLVLGTPASL